MDSTATNELKQTKRLGQFLDEQAKIKARMKRRWEQNEADQKRLSKLRQLVHREQLVALVGVPGGVKQAYRASGSDPHVVLNDARATIHKVYRTMAEVTWDTPSERFGGTWRWPLENLSPVEEEQGFVVYLGKGQL